jgi:hypothetical protein
MLEQLIFLNQLFAFQAIRVEKDLTSSGKVDYNSLTVQKMIFVISL